MKKCIILSTLSLSACAILSNTSNVPDYSYENTHILDNVIKNYETCIVIDNNKTSYKKGVKKLNSDPFLGKESYSPANVKKTKRAYDYAFDNIVCENPVEIYRKITVSSIVYPGTCVGQSYAGSVYTGGTTYSSGYGTASAIGNTVYGSYSGISNSHMNSIPIYDTYTYLCIKEQYVIEIKFYNGSKYIGKISNKHWTSNDPDYTINAFTQEFIDLVNRENTNRIASYSLWGKSKE